jgi:hypothetical protein
VGMVFQELMRLQVNGGAHGWSCVRLPTQQGAPCVA